MEFDALEFLWWSFLAMVKFLFVPSTMIGVGYTFWQTIVNTIVGAVFGVFVFYNVGELIFSSIDRWRGKKGKQRKKFTKMNRFVVRFKSRFGVWGLAAMVGIISVPICSVLAARYFGGNSRTVFVLILSVIVWTFALTSISFFFRGFFT